MDKTNNDLMEEVLDLCLEDEQSHDLLNEWLDHCVQMVQNFMAEGVTQLPPVLFAPVPMQAVTGYTFCVMPLPGLPSDPVKAQVVFYAAGGACVETTQSIPLAVFWALEIFKAPPVEEVSEIRVRPSQHPDRTEHILILGSTPAGVVNMAELDITGRDEQGHLLLAAPRPVYAPAPADITISAPILSPFWKGVEAGLVKLATAQGQPIA